MKTLKALTAIAVFVAFFVTSTDRPIPMRFVKHIEFSFEDSTRAVFFYTTSDSGPIIPPKSGSYRVRLVSQAAYKPRGARYTVFVFDPPPPASDGTTPTFTDIRPTKQTS